MPTSTRNKNQDTEMFEPAEDAMFERRDFDRPGIRRELAAVQPIAIDDLYVEREDKEFVDPRTMDMPFGPTGLGETGGSGVETVRIDGEEWKTLRYVHGFEYFEEEGVTDIDLQQRASLEMFDFLADANFLKGITDQRTGNQLRPGALQVMKDNIPSARTIDCSSLDASYDEVPENVINYEAYQRISGDLLTRGDPNWDLMIGRQDALAKLNKLQETSSAGRITYREAINMGEARGGVNQDVLIPDELELSVIPRGEQSELADIDEEDELSVDLTTELGPNELILVPDAQVHRQSVFRLSEMPSPETFGPYDLRGGREAVDYAWRYSHKFNPENRYPQLRDYIHLKNIDAIFN
ncbi:hypothetical protein PN419_00350 [Halorubrum ezzemoulense]|uniref:hypothetical protein n=1 Tax=Halorubrum ezzemoulense TaxID=337243 RepID=UPI00232EDD9F|nr:hypothetical protein [Halorubrum ezzemoulense]MDB9247457.1 hypothetical protein [Halorubrum ezzemoulense]MDB9258634.1 hypothetical protein [Halorubrum ezzemoulense]MDB9264508.1 hypothetical protein [Halorubrum ezzemoulense]MDB9268995.1 hypothetical protein [Halorubrum ezzemoulense]MDB9271476.1 hypothetical protein [Halorubrum ezzemoulense]